VSGAATPARTVLYPALSYVLLGGLGFLFSSLLRTEQTVISRLCPVLPVLSTDGRSPPTLRFDVP